MLFFIQFFILFFLVSPDVDSEQMYMLEKVNQLRSNGCYCGSKYMKPVRELHWNTSLRKSALNHAKDMQQRSYFSHYSREGEDVGVRLDRVGYRWEIAGENLGEGQRSFDEVLKDWIKSPEHCEMIMEPRIEEMGVARYGNYWVQHFGKRLSRYARKIN